MIKAHKSHHLMACLPATDNSHVWLYLWSLWSSGHCRQDLLSQSKLNQRWSCWLKSKKSCQYITY